MRFNPSNNRRFPMPVSVTPNTLALVEFERMARQHDLTFAYSDDGRAFRAGEAELAKIKAYAAEHLDPKVAAELWNRIVDERIIGGFQEQFYWKA
jgi:hypothetical protein